MPETRDWTNWVIPIVVIVGAVGMTQAYPTRVRHEGPSRRVSWCGAVSVGSGMIEHMFDIDVVGHPHDEAALVARIAELERGEVRGRRRAGPADRRVGRLPAGRRGRCRGARRQARQGLASEIALARHDSPNSGWASPRVRPGSGARDAVHPGRAAAGVLSEWRATLIVRESACLDRRGPPRRWTAECAPTRPALEGKGDKRIEADAKAIAYALDPHAVVDRAVRAEAERSVTVRPAPDAMTYVTALLPMPQGVAVYAALRAGSRHRAVTAAAAGQVMADTLVERVTGRPADVPVPIAVEPGDHRRDPARRG